jgi:hypothetical protein
VDGFLAQLARRLRIPDADTVTADEVRDWPDGKLEELLAAGILQEIEHGATVICDQCDEQCEIEPQRRTDSRTGKAIGVHICMREEVGGRIEIDLDRLRRWRINSRKLSQLGYPGSKRQTASVQRRQDKRKDELFLLRTALVQHHGLGSGKINWEPATQKRLHELTHWNQPKIHRMMKALFGDDPMQAYRQRCKEQTLKGFLLKEDDGSYNVEAYAPSDDE